MMGALNVPLRATLLYVMHQDKGEWCTLAYLADRAAVPANLVRTVCDDLVANGFIQARLGGISTYGIGVATDFPKINHVMRTLSAEEVSR